MRVILAVLIQIFLLGAWSAMLNGMDSLDATIEGGQSIGPGGGQSIGPGGGQAPDRDQSLGLDPDTLRPYPESEW